MTRPSVLVVDDVKANLEALEAVLYDLGCEIVRASSGNDALRSLLKREFAVMLLDVQMPGMDGYEVARHARGNPATRDVPIIFLTATHDDEDKVLRGYGTGAVDFLFKPINSLILRGKVRVFLDLYGNRRAIVDAKVALERTNAELQAANEKLQQAYRERQAAEAQLVQSAKMASLGKLVAGVAHEVNNPLAFVASHLDTALRSLGRIDQEVLPHLSEYGRTHWSRAGDRLREMAAGIDRIRELVVKLRTFSRLDEGERKRVSVRTCVESVLTILGHRFEDRILVVTSFCEPDLLECFPSLLNQAIMNLVANAIDAIEGEGTIAISTCADAGAFSIVVTDTGRGIPEDLRQRVLEPFYTTKPVGQGTGLGLSITYSIVQKHGGTLDLEGAEGGGTRATIRVPAGAEVKR